MGKKKNTILLKQWIYRDSLKPVAELDGSGNLVSEFVYGAKGNVPDYVVRNGVTYRVISDHLGSPRRVVSVSNSADVPFAASYTSFGEASGTGLEWMPFGFAGGMHDGATGLVRYGARDMDPTCGRWLTRDPASFDAIRRLVPLEDLPPVDPAVLRQAIASQGLHRNTLNMYAYSGDDPVNGLDFSGEATCAELADAIKAWTAACYASCIYSAFCSGPVALACLGVCFYASDTMWDKWHKIPC